MRSLLEMNRGASRVERRRARLVNQPPPVSPYAKNPAGYIRDVLGATLTPTQEEICRLILIPPGRVLVLSGHNVGKSFLAAALISWWYDTFDPGVVISTAPTFKQVSDVLWTEVRIQRGRAQLGGFRGDTACRMWSGAEHWAQGVTANTDTAFAGRHRSRTLFVFDEAVGVKPVYWEVSDTMFQGTEGHAFLAIGNPTDPSSRAYAESQAVNLDGSPKWHVVSMSSCQHPNILAELSGEPPPYPNAVSLAQVEQGVADECDPIPEEEHEATDLYWPPDRCCPCCKGTGNVE